MIHHGEPAKPDGMGLARRGVVLVISKEAQKKPTYFRDHVTPYECLPLPHSPTPRPPIRRIARPPTSQFSSRFDLREMFARTLLPAAKASVPFGFVIVRVRVRGDPQ